jgi:hypothetical protein
MRGPRIPIIDWNNNGTVDGDDIAMTLAMQEEQDEYDEDDEED